MKKASDYRKYAEECRALAKQMPDGKQRRQLMEMAKTWDNLASDQERLLRKNPELDTGRGSEIAGRKLTR
jgi:hypothetical protein